MKTSGENILSQTVRGTIAVLVLLLVASAAFCQKPTVRTAAGDIQIETLADKLNHPWGMAFLPDNRLLVTERAGKLRILNNNNQLSKPLKGTPKVFAKGQGGLLDVALDPNFQQNKLVYLSYSEPGEGNTVSTALGRGRLEGEEIKDFQVIFRQEPKIKAPTILAGALCLHQRAT